jgi:uncharacterized protein YndB with AHSA1/START domain
MWSHEVTAETTAAPETVFRLWADVDGWSDWDDDIEWASLEGPFENGSRGRFKPRGVHAGDFELVNVVPNSSYTVAQRIPLTKLRFDHELAPAEGGRTTITQRVIMSGPLSPLWARIIGPRMQRNFPGVVERMARAAEAREESAVQPLA